MLRLARARSTDEELQYKAALTVGHLASNAVRLLPGAGSTASKSGKAGGVSRSKAGDRTVLGIFSKRHLKKLGNLKFGTERSTCKEISGLKNICKIQ